jgi:hypothetical protein
MLQAALTVPHKRCAKCGAGGLPMGYFPSEMYCIYCEPSGLETPSWGPEDHFSGSELVKKERW